MRFRVKAPVSRNSTLQSSQSLLNGPCSDPAPQLNAEVPESRATGTRASALGRKRGESPPLVLTLTM